MMKQEHAHKSDIMMDISILYRNTQKYFDRKLEPLKLTYAQLPVLFAIYEEEGVSMQRIVENGQYDKGTVTKNVQKLENLGYIKTVPSKVDKRLKHLYPTNACAQIMPTIYQMRADWWTKVTTSMDREQLDVFQNTYSLLSANVSAYAAWKLDEFRFYDLDPLCVGHEPGKLSACLYTAGCNLRCPDCPRKDLVYLKESKTPLIMEKVSAFLEERKHFLSALCIQGGEACLNPELSHFFIYVKQMGYTIILKTNGTKPKVLKQWIEENAVDRIWFNFKSPPRLYAKKTGMDFFDFSLIEQTLQILKTIPDRTVVETRLALDLFEGGLEEMAGYLDKSFKWIWHVDTSLQNETILVEKERCQHYVKEIEIRYANT